MNEINDELRNGVPSGPSVDYMSKMLDMTKDAQFKPIVFEDVDLLDVPKLNLSTEEGRYEAALYDQHLKARCARLDETIYHSIGTRPLRIGDLVIGKLVNVAHKSYDRRYRGFPIMVEYSSRGKF